MKHLKSYKLFESSESDTVKKDIEEICYDITDYGRFKITTGLRKVKPNYYKGRVEVPEQWYIHIALLDHLDYDGFLLSEVEDTLMRVKSYLGLGRFISCDVLLVGEQDRSRLNYISDEDRKNNINFPSSNGINKLTDEDRITNIIIYYTL